MRDFSTKNVDEKWSFVPILFQNISEDSKKTKKNIANKKIKIRQNFIDKFFLGFLFLESSETYEIFFSSKLEPRKIMLRF